MAKFFTFPLAERLLVYRGHSLTELFKKLRNGRALFVPPNWFSDFFICVFLTRGLCCVCGPGSVVGIATGYGLDGPGIESRWGARFSAPVQTGPGAHPASCTMGTSSFPGIKSGRGVTLTPHPLLVPWS